MKTDRRHAYRVAMENGEPIRAEVSSEGGSLLGEVLDLSLYGCSVRVPLTQAPIVPVGGTVTLTLHASDTKSVTITATVQASTGRDKFRRMGLAFSNPAALHAMLSPKLLRWFNERRALRVQPRPPVSVAVDVPGQERRLTGRMLDISAEGVGVVVDGESAQELSQVVRVGLEFTLPGHTGPTVLRAFIRYRAQLEEEAALYIGLSLDPEGSSDFISEQQRITEYVTELQRDRGHELVGATVLP